MRRLYFDSIYIIIIITRIICRYLIQITNRDFHTIVIQPKKFSKQKEKMLICDNFASISKPHPFFELGFYDRINYENVKYAY